MKSGRKPWRTDAEKKEARRQAYLNNKLKFPERNSARNIINSAVRRGVVVPMLCWVCGEKAEAHHPDYSRPLEVVWLCNKHHRETHELFSVGL